VEELQMQRNTLDSGGNSNAKKHPHKHHSRQIHSQNEKRVKGYQGQIDMAEFRGQSNAANRKRRRLDGAVNNSEEAKVVILIQMSWDNYTLLGLLLAEWLLR
jgi:hypothetical protein